MCPRTTGFLGTSALTPGPAEGCAGEQSHAPHPCGRCLLHSDQSSKEMPVAHCKRGLDIPYHLAENLPETLALPMSKLRSLSSLKCGTVFEDRVPAGNPCGRDSPTTSLSAVYLSWTLLYDQQCNVFVCLRGGSRQSWGRVSLFLCPILALNATYKGHTCTKGRGWNICRPANCLDCGTTFVQLGTHMYVPQHAWGEGADREMQERGWLPQHLSPTLPSASPDCRRDAVSC